MRRLPFKAIQLQVPVLLIGLLLTAVFFRFDLVLRQEQQIREAQQRLSAVSANRHLDLNQPDQQQQFAEGFDQFTRTLDDLTSGILTMQIALGSIVRYVSNIDSNSAASGHDLLVDGARCDQELRAICDRRTILNGPLDLLQGSNTIIARKAVSVVMT